MQWKLYMEPRTCKQLLWQPHLKKDSITAALLPFNCLCRMFLFSGRIKCFWSPSAASKYSYSKAVIYCVVFYIYTLERNPTVALIITFKSHRTNFEQRHKYTFTHFFNLVTGLAIPPLVGYSRLCHFKARPLLRRLLIWDTVNVKAHFTCDR